MNVCVALKVVKIIEMFVDEQQKAYFVKLVKDKMQKKKKMQYMVMVSH